MISVSSRELSAPSQEVDLKVAALGPANRSHRYAAVIEDGVIKVRSCSKSRTTSPSLFLLVLYLVLPPTPSTVPHTSAD
jgi:hypothetical protein